MNQLNLHSLRFTMFLWHDGHDQRSLHSLCFTLSLWHDDHGTSEVYIHYALHCLCDMMVVNQRSLHSLHFTLSVRHYSWEPAKFTFTMLYIVSVIWWPWTSEVYIHNILHCPHDMMAGNQQHLDSLRFTLCLGHDCREPAKFTFTTLCIVSVNWWPPTSEVYIQIALHCLCDIMAVMQERLNLVRFTVSIWHEGQEPAKFTFGIFSLRALFCG